MLGPGRYLLGVAAVALLAGFAWLGATRVRALLLPRFEGAPAHLTTSLIALALLIWSAELLGAFGAFVPAPFWGLVIVLGVGLWALLPRVARGRGPRPQLARTRTPARGQDPRGGEPPVPTLIALAIAAMAVVRFAVEAKTRLSTGMTGFDSTWYHGPFAAGFFQSGDTWNLHFIAPQFLAWFYPANGEIFHAVGMLAFGRDILSPLLNLGWFMGCLAACWCIGRPYRVAPWSLALGAVALSVPALADQAGEARNDIVGIFFLLAAVAISLNAWGSSEEGRLGQQEDDPGLGSFLAVGLAASLAAGTKLNFLLPAAVLVAGVAFVAPSGTRWRALVASGLAALAAGGYWYLRNLVHTGNPLPWIDGVGPISLPAPDQALGGREAHGVLGYLTDGAVWTDWFLPGLHDGLWLVWPLLLASALAGLVLCLLPGSSLPPDSGSKGRRSPDRALFLAGLVGLTTALAWLLAPTSASGPDGLPRGFESGLRYLAPALVLGLALLPTAALLHGRRERFERTAAAHMPFVAHRATKGNRFVLARSRAWLLSGVALALVTVGLGYPVQRHYLEGRYADPTFTAPGLNAAFAWSRDVSDAKIATTSTRQYPLFGADLSNDVEFIGLERPHGGFEAATTCRSWRQELNAGGYDYVIATRDRLEPGKPPYPPQVRWTEGPAAKPILEKPPTVVFRLTGPLDPSACR